MNPYSVIPRSGGEAESAGFLRHRALQIPRFARDDNNWDFACGLRRSELRLCRVAVSCLLLLFASPLFARSWRVADFNDTISVHEDGSAVVHERITLAFDGEWHGIHRFIPVEYPGARGTNYTLFLNVTGVTDGNGGKLKYESSTSNGFRDLKILHSQTPSMSRAPSRSTTRFATGRASSRITTSFTGT